MTQEETISEMVSESIHEKHRFLKVVETQEKNIRTKWIIRKFRRIHFPGK